MIQVQSVLHRETVMMTMAFVFLIEGLFILVTLKVRYKRYITWLAATCFLFSAGWFLLSLRPVYGDNLITIALSNVLILQCPILSICAIYSFLNSGQGKRFLKRSLLVSLGYLFFLGLTLHNFPVLNVGASCVNAYYFFLVAWVFKKGNQFHNGLSKVIIGCNGIIVFSLAARSLLIVAKAFWPDWITQEMLVEVFMSSLFIGLLSEYANINGLLLLDFAQSEYELKEINAQLTQVAERDALTGVFNRRVMASKLDTEVYKSNYHNRPLSIIMLDVDHFKRINDTHGHHVGDQVLFETAQIITKNCRTNDIVTRYGGEEFVVILPKTTIQEALMIANRIRLAIATYPFAQSLNVPMNPVTVSLGLATLQVSDSPNELLNIADRALYRAKGCGRNRICGDGLDLSPGCPDYHQEECCHLNCPELTITNGFTSVVECTSCQHQIVKEGK